MVGRDHRGGCTTRIPDFGGYVVKADSEGQPGPFAYGRRPRRRREPARRRARPARREWCTGGPSSTTTARTGGTGRPTGPAPRTTTSPRSTGGSATTSILQVKHGPMDFQTREPVSPVIAAMPATRLAVEFQVTQEYTGQQRHVCYLGPMWSEVLRFRPWGPAGATVADVAAGDGGAGGGLVAVVQRRRRPVLDRASAGAGQPVRVRPARLGPGAGPGGASSTSGSTLTFPPRRPPTRSCCGGRCTRSWTTRGAPTSGTPRRWASASWSGPGTTTAPTSTGTSTPRGAPTTSPTATASAWTAPARSGTGFTGQYPPPWSRGVRVARAAAPTSCCCSSTTCRTGTCCTAASTVIQHIYDTHFAGVEEVAAMRRRWAALRGPGRPGACTRGWPSGSTSSCAAPASGATRSTRYFFRKSGVPDARGRGIY